MEKEKGINQNVLKTKIENSVHEWDDCLPKNKLKSPEYPHSLLNVVVGRCEVNPYKPIKFPVYQ